MLYKIVRTLDNKRVGMANGQDAARNGASVMVSFVNSFFMGEGCGAVAGKKDLWYVEFLVGDRLVREEFTIAPANLRDQIYWYWSMFRTNVLPF